MNRDLASLLFLAAAVFFTGSRVIRIRLGRRHRRVRRLDGLDRFDGLDQLGDACPTKRRPHDVRACRIADPENVERES